MKEQAGRSSWQIRNLHTSRVRRQQHPPLGPLHRASPRYKKTPAQVLLRWALDQDLAVIPGATSPAPAFRLLYVVVALAFAVHVQGVSGVFGTFG